MKKSKTALLFTSIFAAAVNMNGCGVYGPPETFDPRWNIAQPEYGAPYYVEPTMAVEQTEMDWYQLTERRYAVLRIVSTPEAPLEGEPVPENAIYGVELLSFYTGDGMDLSEVTRVSLRWKNRYLLSEGDVVFAELGEAVQEGDALCCEMKYDALGPVYTRFAENQLSISDKFKLQEIYGYLCDFNGHNEWSVKVNQTGVVNEITGEPVYFADGMTVEEAALFFTALQKAQEANENASGNE